MHTVIDAILRSAITWGAIGLILAAISFTGKINMNTVVANALLILAGAISCYGIYRSPIPRNPYLVLACCLSLVAIMSWIAYWLRPSPVVPPAESRVPKSGISDSVDAVVTRHDLSEAAGRESIRNQLSLFIVQGEELQSKLVSPQLSDTDADSAVAKWDKTVRRFLHEHMGTNYVARFGSAEGIPNANPLAEPGSKIKRELWCSIHRRNLRLQQFIQATKD